MGAVCLQKAVVGSTGQFTGPMQYSETVKALKGAKANLVEAEGAVAKFKEQMARTRYTPAGAERAQAELARLQAKVCRLQSRVKALEHELPKMASTAPTTK